MKQQRRSIRKFLGILQTIGEIILNDSIGDNELRDRLFEAIPKEQLAMRMESLSEWVSGNKSALFYGVVGKFGYLRRFSPAFLEALEFMPEFEGAHIPCLDGLHVLKGLNVDNRRSVPMDVTDEFVPKRLMSLIRDNQSRIDKGRLECALLIKLRDEIKAGNLYVKHSKRFGRFDDFFIPKERWIRLRDTFFRRSGLPQTPSDVPGYLCSRLAQVYDRFLETAQENSYATVDENGWRLSADYSEKLDPISQKKLDHLKEWLGKNMRQIKLPDLLIKVDNELSFTEHFLSLSHRQKRIPRKYASFWQQFWHMDAILDLLRWHT